MTRLTRSTSLFATAAAFLLLLPAAEGGGCGNDDVIIGDDGGGAGGTGGGDADGGAGGDGGSAPSCYVGGCSGQLCTDDPDAGSSCEYTPSYACYDVVGICEADADGQCGWRDTAELQQCIDNANGVNRDPVDGQCIRNAGDMCVTDADCMADGCGGELCFNPDVSNGVSTCDCGPPQVTGCGCVAGSCTWYN